MGIRLEAQPIAPAPGAPRLPAGERRHTVVVGGGLAGISAAAVLAERGIAVTLLEAADSLGGRLRGWAETLADGTQVEMDRGFHAFFRQYYNLRALLGRIADDPEAGALVPLADYPLLGPNGHSESFSGLPRLTPLNLMALVARTPTIKARDLVDIPTWPTFEMLAYDPDGTYARFDEMSAKDFLDQLNFPPQARQMLFEVFAHSFFNPEADMSAADMLRMFHIYFTGNPEGLLFDVLDAPFDRGLFGPLERYLRSLGVDVACGQRVTAVRQDGGQWVVSHEGGEDLVADAVVLALDVDALRQVVANSADAGLSADWAERVASQRPTNPFAVWRLWLDRAARADRLPFAGTAGLGIIDNISLYERFQDEARSWSAANGGASVVELHAYALPDEMAGDPEAIKAALWEGCIAAYPELRGARVVDERFRVDQDCPAFPPGQAHLRPTVRTPHRGLVLAGDLVKLPFPAALMEAAASSGMLAANALLADWGVAGETLTALPSRGLLTSPADGRLAKLKSTWQALRRDKRVYFGRRPRTPLVPALTGPDWQQASPMRIQRALDAAQALPSGGWYVLDASRSIGESPRAFTVAGVELVAWRDGGGALRAGPEACPHMGASLACAPVRDGEIVCPWHGLRLGKGRHGSWAPMTVHDDGVLAWVQLPAAGDGVSERPTERPILAPRPAQFMDAVIAMEAACDPEDIIANRLDPWHGTWFHPYSFDTLVVTGADDRRLAMRVAFKVGGPVVVEVDVTFHCPDPRTIVMTIVDGEGVGSVVETHATPIAPGRSRVIEATLATSARRGFGRLWHVRNVFRPFMQRTAERLWVDDIAYAERRYALRQKGVTPGRLQRAS